VLQHLLSPARRLPIATTTKKRRTMNSPPEPASPSASTPSSDTTPPDVEHNVEPVATTIPAAMLNLNNSPMRGPTASQTKRRLPMGSSSMHGSRDSKARRRDDGGNVGKRGMGIAMSALGEGRDGRMKEDLVDLELMDKLKNEFGDPFDDSVMNL